MTATSWSTSCGWADAISTAICDKEAGSGEILRTYKAFLDFREVIEVVEPTGPDCSPALASTKAIKRFKALGKTRNMLKTPVLHAEPKTRSPCVGPVCAGFSGAGRALVQLGLRHHDDLRLKASARTNQAVERPEIHDRFGRVLAMDVPTSSLYADPKILLGVDETVEKLAVVLPSLDLKKLRNSLFTKRRFVWIKRFLTPDQRRAVYDLGLPGLYFLREPKRFYPLGAQTAHLVGTVDRDNKGLSGIEQYVDQLMEDERSSPNEPYGLKQPVILSLDMRVQNGVVRELQKALASL